MSIPWNQITFMLDGRRLEDEDATVLSLATDKELEGHDELVVVRCVLLEDVRLEQTSAKDFLEVVFVGDVWCIWHL